MPMLSIVIPVYYNEGNLFPLYEDLAEKVLSVIDAECELVFVDDGSGDGSWAELTQLAARYGNENIQLCRLSRNFGSHAAVMCGLSHAKGDCAVVKAADMQEPAEMILHMYASWQAGNNVVLAVREGREDAGFFSNAYYWLVRKMALPRMPKGGFDTFLLDRRVIEVLERMDEKNSAITGQILWSGFRTDSVYYTRKARTIGKSRWTLKKKIRLVSDTLYSFTNAPIALVSGIGVVSCAGSLIWALVVLISKLAGVIDVSGWTTLFIFSLFSFGIIMLSLGILGSYLWRAFDASRGRPLYIIEQEGPDTPQRGTPPTPKGEDAP